MSPLDLAHRYLEIFFSGGNFERLEGLLAEKCVFTGPLFEFENAGDYIDSLLADPPRDCEYELISAMHHGNAAQVLYWFRKPGIEVMMSQYFEIKDNRISRIMLVFDTGQFRHGGQ